MATRGRPPEDLQTDLILLALGSAMVEGGSLPYLSKTRLMKLVYAVAEKAQADVTRGWYRYGWYIYQQSVNPERLFELIGRTVGTNQHRVREVNQAAFGRHAAFYRQVRSIAQEIAEAFAYRTTEDIIEDLYYGQAPERYRDLYAANRRLLALGRAISDSSTQRRLPLHESIVEDYGKHLSALHMAVGIFDHEEAQGLLIATSSFMELLLFKLERLADDQRHTAVRFFGEIAEFYEKDVWGTAAARIFEMTVKGAREEEARHWAQGQLSEVGGYFRRLLHYQTVAQQRNLAPSLEELDALVQSRRSQLGKTFSEFVDALLTASVEGEGSGPRP